MDSTVDTKIPSEVVDYIGAALGKLGEQWELLRDLGKEEAAAVVLANYHGLVRYLLATGWRGGLPPETELPEEYMPEEYIKMFEEEKKAFMAEAIEKGWTERKNSPWEQDEQ